MTAYEFYWRDKKGRDHLIGILPERRKDPERITQESILNFVTANLGHEVNGNKIYYFQVTLDERIGEILWPKPSFGAQEMV